VKGLYANPIRTSDLLILLGLAFLALSALFFVLAPIPRQFPALGLESDCAPENLPNRAVGESAEYANLYKRTEMALMDRALEEGRRYRIIAVASVALGIVFLMWGLDRRQLTRKLEQPRTDDQSKSREEK